jgi:hypothetical protein
MDTRDSSDEISQGKPLEISDKIWMNDPRENQALGWVLRQGVKNSTANHAFGHLEDVPFPNWVKYTGAADATETVTGLVFADAGNRLTAYSRIMNARTGEVLLFTADFASATTSGAVDRAWGQTWSSAMDLRPDDKFLILTPNQYEGFTTGEGMTNTKVYKSFVTEIVDWAVRVTDTEYAEKARGGNPFAYALKKAWKAAKDQMESGLIFGAKAETTIASGEPIRASEGLLNYVSTNVWAVDGYMTRQDFWDILAEWTVLNKNGGAVFCSKAFRHMVTNWAMQKTQYNQDTKKDGMEILQVITPDGTFDLVELDVFNQHPDLMGRVLLVPYGQIEYRPLIGAKDLDVRYYPIQRDEVHVEEGEIYGEYGWEFFQEELFGSISGIEF